MITDAFVQLFAGLIGLPFRAMASFFNPQFPQAIRDGLHNAIDALWGFNAVIPVPDLLSIVTIIIGIEAFLAGLFFWSWAMRHIKR